MQLGVEKVYVVDMPALNDDDVARDSVRAAVDPQTGRPVVVMQFTHQGEQRFTDLTRKLARRGMQEKSPQHLLVVVDDEVYASPYIDFNLNPDGIPGDNGMQLDVPTLRKARELARSLRG